jgi:uncharacterized protein YegP (UPF0339 family)
MLSGFKIKQGKNGDYYWHIKAKNGEIVADGSEGYKTTQGLKNGFKSLLENIGIDEAEVNSILAQVDKEIEKFN